MGNNLPKNKNLISGQALLLVLVVMTVVLTVVLSAVSRSVTDVSVSTYEAESLRAFSAAEAGIEQALIENLQPGDEGFGDYVGEQSTPDESRYEAEVNFSEPVSGLYGYPALLESGETALISLASRNNSTTGFLCDGSKTCYGHPNMDVCWGDSSEAPAVTPAIEVVFYFDPTVSTPSWGELTDFGNVTTKRFPFDPDSTRGNGFATPSGTSDCVAQGYRYGHSFNLAADIGGCIGQHCLLEMKVRMLYNTEPQKLGVIGGADFPPQGILIESVGDSGETTRKVEVFQGYPEPPFVFDNAVFGGTGISSN